ncbi:MULTISPECIES: hypothetical protein, partial [unclassified Pseudomonas]|uniref:hypothetical protein n=1 Tax=unclassified Pseudomonas TaxID=196821 RepID=UPI003F9B6335
MEKVFSQAFGKVDTGLASLCVTWCLDAAAVCSETPCFALSGDSLFFEIGLPPSAKKSKQKKRTP